MTFQRSRTAFLGLLAGAPAAVGLVVSAHATPDTLRGPPDFPGVLERALLVREDWTNAATFDPDAIDRERGIVLSEWRMHLGAGERTQDKIREVQLEGSRYAVRSPIGKTD